MREFDPTRRAALGSGMALLAAAPLVAAQAAPRPSATMQAYQVGRQQGIDSLSLAERAVPHAGPGEVIVGVRASALNHRDLSILAGQYGAAKPPQRNQVPPRRHGPQRASRCPPRMAQPRAVAHNGRFPRWMRRSP